MSYHDLSKPCTNDEAARRVAAFIAAVKDARREYEIPDVSVIAMVFINLAPDGDRCATYAQRVFLGDSSHELAVLASAFGAAKGEQRQIIDTAASAEREGNL